MKHGYVWGSLNLLDIESEGTNLYSRFFTAKVTQHITGL